MSDNFYELQDDIDNTIKAVIVVIAILGLVAGYILFIQYQGHLYLVLVKKVYADPWSWGHVTKKQNHYWCHQPGFYCK